MENMFFKNIEEYIMGVESEIIVNIDGDLYFEKDLNKKIDISKYKQEFDSACKINEIKNKVLELEMFLTNTDYKFTDDYDSKDTPEWLELKAKRQEAREFIRANK